MPYDLNNSERYEWLAGLFPYPQGCGHSLWIPGHCPYEPTRGRVILQIR